MPGIVQVEQASFSPKSQWSAEYWAASQRLCSVGPGWGWESPFPGAAAAAGGGCYWQRSPHPPRHPLPLPILSHNCPEQHFSFLPRLVMPTLKTLFLFVWRWWGRAWGWWWMEEVTYPFIIMLYSTWRNRGKKGPPGEAGENQRQISKRKLLMKRY